MCFLPRMQVGFLSRCLIPLNGTVTRWSIVGIQMSENGTRPSPFPAHYGVAADRMSRVASRESFPEQGGGMQTERRISLPFVSALTGFSEAETSQSCRRGMLPSPQFADGLSIFSITYTGTGPLRDSNRRPSAARAPSMDGASTGAAGSAAAFWAGVERVARDAGLLP